MTDEEQAHLRETVPAALALEAQVSTNKARRAIALLAVSVLVVVGLAIGALIVVVAGKNNQDSTNGRELAAIRQELQTAQATITKNAATNDERDQCERVLTAAVRGASRDTQAGVARLVIIISTTPLAERDAAIGDGVSKLQTAVTAYDGATNALNAWQSLPLVEQLPCPVPVAK